MMIMIIIIVVEMHLYWGSLEWLGFFFGSVKVKNPGLENILR